jgi:CheY-like chemotaxis protein
MIAQPDKKNTVLWADDDADDLLLMREILERTDDRHHVLEMSNGRDVLQYLSAIEDSENFPCLIILDVNMPILNGLETLVQIKSNKKFQSIPVVLFTTSDGRRERPVCNRYNVKLFSKPNQYSEYRNVIMQLLTHCSDRINSIPALNKAS